MTEVATVPQGRETGLSYKTIGIAQTGGGGMLLPQTFGDVVAFSAIMARAKIAIPKHLRDNDGACMAVTMQALRWEMDPFAVAAKSYAVNDMIAYEAQLIAAVVHTRAPIKRRPDYEFIGESDDLRCRITCEMLDGSVKTYESPRTGDIKTKNSPLWKTDPQQQLGYFSIRSWARRYTPEVLLGVYAPDELDEFGPDRARDVTPRPSIADRLPGRPGTTGFATADIEGEIAEARSSQPAARQAREDAEAPAPRANAGGDDVDAATHFEPNSRAGNDEAGPVSTTDDSPSLFDEASPGDEAGADRAEPAPLTHAAAVDTPSSVDGQAEAERPADPSVGLSAEDREHLRLYHEHMGEERAEGRIRAHSQAFWDNAAPKEGSELAAAATAIYAAHRQRVRGEISIAECDRLAREARV